MTHSHEPAIVRIATLLLLCFGLSTTAFAQASVYDQDAEFWTMVHDQFEQNLQDPIPAVRAQTLKNVVFFSTFFRDRIDLADQVERIVSIHQTGDDDATRDLALAALHAIGSTEAMAYVESQLTPSESVDVRGLVVSILTEYFRFGSSDAIATR